MRVFESDNMADLTHFITVYENTFLPQDCQNLIGKFEKNKQCHKVEHKRSKNDDWRMSFTQLNLAENSEFELENQQLKQLFLRAIKAYKKEHNIQSHQWPENFKLEPIRMKRYLPNTEDAFDEHVDVTNYASARRFLVLFIYLNDSFEGGETDFTQFKIKVKPKEGNLLIFPPLWNWLHQGCSVTGDNPKYIVGTYMHYI